MLSRLATELLPRCAFPRPGSTVNCAVSGGADSLALLALAVCAGGEVTAFHVDHGIRAGSADEASVVQAAAERLGAQFVALRVACPPGPNLEARARRERFLVLPEDIATGHTADDQAETVILNLLRGSGSAGLSGMRCGPRHPILRLRRAETRRLVASLDLAVVEDPSNEEPRHRRNRVRHEVLPLLDTVARRDLAPLLARQAELLGAESELLDELAEAIDPTDVAALRSAAAPLARRSVRAFLRTLDAENHPPDAAAVERVLAVARGEVRACEVAGGCEIRRSAGRLVISSPRRQPPG